MNTILNITYCVIICLMIAVTHISAAPLTTTMECDPSPVAGGFFACEDQYRLLKKGEKTTYCPWSILVCMTKYFRKDLETVLEDFHEMKTKITELKTMEGDFKQMKREIRELKEKK